jgi:hypothetical protein
MSKFFNTTNRFDALNDNNHDNKKNQSKINNYKSDDKNEKPLNKEVNHFKKESLPQLSRSLQYERNTFGKRRNERKPSFEKNEYSLEMDHFPDLNTETLKVNKEEIKKMNFMEKVQNSGKENMSLSTSIEEKNKDYIKPGWVCLYKHPNTNQIIWKYGEPISSMLKEDKPNPSDVLDALVETYEKQIAYYDMLWGEGAHDRHYKSPYHDYEYFERLDEMYEEMDEEENIRMEIHRQDYDEEYYRKY